MNKRKWRRLRIRFRQVDASRLDERMLLANAYLTQALMLGLALVLLFFQKRKLGELMSVAAPADIFLWGGGLAAAVIAADLVLSRWVPEEVSDDGGINEKLFGNRPVWHIALLSLIVAFSEEMLFRGVVQHWLGPYWTSVLFAAIHVRYLRHWLMTGLVFSISYGLGWIYLQTGTLWTPILAHFVIDFVMGLLLRRQKRQQG